MLNRDTILMKALPDSMQRFGGWFHAVVCEGWINDSVKRGIERDCTIVNRLVHAGNVYRRIISVLITDQPEVNVSKRDLQTWKDYAVAIMGREDMGFQLVCQHMPKINKTAYSSVFDEPLAVMYSNHAKRSHLEQLFMQAWAQYGADALPPLAECFVDPYRNRNWRFDLCWPEYKLAIELQGGTWVRGRHSRGGGQTSDYEKHNFAVLNDWRILYFTSDMLSRSRSAGCIEIVNQLIQRIKK